MQPIADEIIVLDSGSTDNTPEIATKLGAKVIHQDWLGYAAQKNKVIGLAGGEWILSLDADEVLTPPLVAEIKDTIETSNGLNGYKIPRVLLINQRPYKHGGFYPDAQLRLFRKGTGRFEDRVVHEAMTVDPPVGMLRNDMLHYAYTDVADFEANMDKYARLSAQHYFRKGKSGWRSSFINEMLHPVWTFFYRFIMRCGFLDGLAGARLNLIYSDYVRKKIQYLRQLTNEEKK